MRISTRLSLITNVTIAALLILIPILSYNFSAFNNAKDDHAFADSIHENFIERTSFRNQYFLYREDRVRAQWDKSKQTADELLRRARAQFRHNEEQKILARLQNSIADTALIFHRIVDNTRALAGENSQVYAEHDRRLFSQLMLKAAAVENTSIVLQNMTAARAENAYQQLVVMMFAFVLMLSVVVILTAMHLNRLIKRRLLPLHAGLERIARGNLNHRLYSEDADEFGDLARSINDMTNQLQQTNSALQVSELRWKFALEGAGEGVWERNLLTNDMYLSKRFEDILGYPEGEFEHSGEKWRNSIHPVDLSQAMHTLDTYLTSNAAVYYNEYRMLCKDGDYKWVLARGMVTERDIDGKPSRLTGTLADISERKQVEASLIEAQQAADSANVAKSQFLANMSHEIRTPMNSILGMTYLALKVENESKKRDYLEKIQLSGKHLLGIINDILDYSKLNAGKLNLEEHTLDFDSILKHITNLLADQVKAKCLEISIEIDATLGSQLRGDTQRITQVLVNFFSNAVKFSEKGKIVLRALNIEEAEASCLVRFEVQDSGIGVDDAEKSLLFQPFMQIKSTFARGVEGTGLGLAICAQMAKLMKGGKVGVESALGLGSTFWLMVRLEKAGQLAVNLLEDRYKSIAEDEALIRAALRGAYILVAEDNLFNQQVVSEILENAGAIVCVARNGQEALDLLKQNRFDCVLMDMRMPVLNGLETTRLIRADLELAGLPVIAMTANVALEDRERCLGVGMNAFIGKPFEALDLYNVIVKCMKGIPAPATTAMPAGDQEHNDGTLIINFSVLGRPFAGDKLKMHEFALKFLASARLDMAEVDAALERYDLTALSTLGHHIRGASKMAGTEKFSSLCKMLETDSNDGETMEQLKDIVTQMHQMMDLIYECIDTNKIELDSKKFHILQSVTAIL